VADKPPWSPRRPEPPPYLRPEIKKSSTESPKPPPPPESPSDRFKTATTSEPRSGDQTRQLVAKQVPVVAGRRFGDLSGKRSLVILATFFLTGVGVITLRDSRSTTVDDSKSALERQSPSDTGSNSLPPTPTGLQDGSTSGAEVEPGSWEEIIKSIAYITVDCGTGEGPRSGSGTIVIDGSYVLTNNHVAESADCMYQICFTDKYDTPPNDCYDGSYVTAERELDLAVLQIIDVNGNPTSIPKRKPISLSGLSIPLNETITLIGYPGIGGATVTLVTGRFGGIEHLADDDGDGWMIGEFYKTDARSGRGVSGGAAFDGNKRFVGVPTGGAANSDLESLGYVRPAKYAIKLLESIKAG